MSDRVRTGVVRRPRAGQVLVRQRDIGPTPQRAERQTVAVGVIEAVGDGVVGFVAGDRVAYGTEPGGTSDATLMSADKLIGIPPRVTDRQAAALLAAGLAARILVKETYPIGHGGSVLVRAAAAGIGAMIVPWAKALGATVIAAVGSDSGGELAGRLGADHVIVREQAGPETDTDLVARVREITRGSGVDVVYDGGSGSLPASADCARRGGAVVAYGGLAGRPDESGEGRPLGERLAARDVRLLRPVARRAHAGTLQLAAAEVFLAIRDGVFRELPIGGQGSPALELSSGAELAA